MKGPLAIDLQELDRSYSQSNALQPQKHPENVDLGWD
jgi:hypothetical protein